MNLDLRSFDGLVKEVYAPQVVIDYTSMFGGKPMETTNEEWAKSLEPMMAGFDAMQHIVMYVTSSLSAYIIFHIRRWKLTINQGSVN